MIDLTRRRDPAPDWLNEPASPMDAYRRDLLHCAWFGLKAPSLAALSRADADKARADVHDHYWRAGFTGHLNALDFSNRCLTAIDAAQSVWALQVQISKPPMVKGRAKRNNAKIRHTLFERDGPDCWVCGRELGEDRTIEHVESLANGGTWALDNLRLAHYHCNQAMGDMSVAEKDAARAAIRINNKALVEV